MKPLRTLLTAVLAIAAGAAVASAGEYLAFSLREAQVLAQGGVRRRQMIKLGGITRIVGMVHDPAGDVVLVGRAIDGQPEGSLDDLVVAMRSRITLKQWPTVSIDPTDETPKTGLQKVTYLGGISGTPFGKIFLDSDVFLKTYSLQLCAKVEPVKSYREMCAESIKTGLERKGIRVSKVSWMSAEEAEASVKGMGGKTIRTQECSQTRFWFAPQQPYRFVAREGVFCIKELRLVVTQEPVAADAAVDPEMQKTAELFAQQFSAHLKEMTASQPMLARLKMLYDYVAVADGISHLKEPPPFSYFLNDYKAAPAETGPAYKLIQLVGFVSRDDGLPQIVQLSGGIRFETELKWLNDGDVTPLREIVLRTKPDARALTWELPIDDWKMPNTHDLPADEPAAAKPAKAGCNVAVQSYVLGPAGDSDMKKKFTGFFPPPPPPPPLAAGAAIRGDRLNSLSGVSMKVDVNDKSFTYDASDELDKIREGVLKSRPDPGKLEWSPEEEEK